MKTYPLKAEQVPEFLAGATTLRIPVRPQPHFPYDAEGLVRLFVDPEGELWYEATDKDGIPWTWPCLSGLSEPIPCPYPVGSELALTEAWAMGWVDPFMPATVFYKADNCLSGMQWRRAVTMPAEFSRFKRRILAVNVEHRELWEWVLELEAL